jgi:hypothetical protein
MEEFLAGILARFAYFVIKALIVRLLAHQVWVRPQSVDPDGGMERK